MNANSDWGADQRSNWRRWLNALVLATLLGAGCNLPQWAQNGFKVGPNYLRPQAPVASEWIDYHDPRVKSREADMSEWWRVFKDPTLSALIDKAYDQNLSLRVAGARILQAQAQRGIAVGTLFPQVQQAAASYTRNKYPTTTGLPEPPEKWLQEWNTGFNASWELDLWGRFRRSIEASDAELDASIENYDNVLVILLADVATSYVQYRTFGERLVYARKNLEIQTKSYELAEDKFKHGAVTERDLQMAKQNLEQTRSLIPPLEIGERQSRNLLCVLLGIPPSDLGPLLAKAADIPKAPNEVTVGIPADLLRRRPDVRQAERLVAAQSARIGVATADFYPRLTLNGTIGLSAEQFGQLFHTPGSMTGSFGPEFRWDILNYGRILNNVRAQDAIFEGLAFTYQNTVLNAARETEDALVGFLRTQTQAENLAASVAAANRTAEIALDQYRQGAVDFFPVYYFESILTQQQDQLAVARGQIALDLIGVYRALGGGWQMRLTRDGDNGPAPEQLPPLAIPAVPMRGGALPPTSSLDSPIRNTRKITEKSKPLSDSSVRAPDKRKMIEKTNPEVEPKADSADIRRRDKSEEVPKAPIPTSLPEHAPEI